MAARGMRAGSRRTAMPRAAAFSRRAPAAGAVAVAAEKFTPLVNPKEGSVPTVADTKRAFIESYPKPIPAMYNTVIQELLVGQHVARYQAKYQYDPVSALGFSSVFDGIMDGAPLEADKIFDAYISALAQDPATFRDDTAALEAWAGAAGGIGGLVPDAAGDAVQQRLAGVAQMIGDGDFFYSKFFAIGLFRILELGGATEPDALKSICEAFNVSSERVNTDLLNYKNVLSRMAKGKELMQEFLERERKKKAARAAEKAAEASAEQSSE